MAIPADDHSRASARDSSASNAKNTARVSRIPSAWA
jgi:hypothetical protein